MNQLTTSLASVMISREVSISRLQGSEDRSYPIDHADRFDVRLRSALENPRLPDNLTAFQQGWRSARDRGFSDRKSVV